MRWQLVWCAIIWDHQDPFIGLSVRRGRAGDVVHRQVLSTPSDGPIKGPKALFAALRAASLSARDAPHRFAKRS